MVEVKNFITVKSGVSIMDLDGVQNTQIWYISKVSVELYLSYPMTMANHCMGAN